MATTPPALTDEQKAALDWFADLTEEAKAGFLIKAMQRFSPAGEGEVKIGASAPGEVPPSGEIDPVTGAPVKPSNGPPPPPPPPPLSSPKPPAPPSAPPPTTATRRS